ncbi:glutamate racemase [Methyloglobulus sp.]|uniref:glutamate racemase n=1 Tax=Methyloglobulus sp. TaxID=2518622 RepID=UPI0039897F11
MHTNPIGVFDSGVGGLSVLREIRKLLPHENLLYVADSAHAPYGDKTKEFILERSTAIVDFFLNQHVKAIVVACNTATGAAVKELRPNYTLPMIAMEPAVKPASERTQTGIIGVLATSKTLSSNNFQVLFARFADQVKILPQACPGLVEQVECGDLASDKTRALIAQYVRPLMAQNVDFIVLGCTHYPFLAPVIQEIAGASIAVIDSGSAIARELKSRLEKTKILSDRHNPGSVQFWSSDETGKAKRVISQLWGTDVEVGNMPERVLA